MRDRRYAWAWLFGAVCPERGVGAAVVLPHVNIEAMNAHLAEIGRRVAEGSHAVLVLDRAGWHTSPRLRVPENISLLWLPPYAPEFEPGRASLGLPARQLPEPPRLGRYVRPYVRRQGLGGSSYDARGEPEGCPCRRAYPQCMEDEPWQRLAQFSSELTRRS